jgi:hypothetical protein
MKGLIKQKLVKKRAKRGGRSEKEEILAEWVWKE